MNPHRATFGLLLGHGMHVALFIVGGCSSSSPVPHSPPRPAATAVSEAAPAAVPPAVVHLESAPPDRLCREEPPGRGCRLSRFQGTCATYFTATQSELQSDLHQKYLSLRAGGDFRSLPVRPPRYPNHYGTAFVGSGLSAIELSHLADLLYFAKPTDLKVPPETVASPVAYGDAYFATAYRVTPEMTRLLATSMAVPDDLHRLAKRWDADSRLRVPSDHFRFSTDSLSDCVQLLEHIFRVAANAVDTDRDMYVVQSLSYANPDYCGERGNCGGYPCRSGDLCASADDMCFSHLDCPNDNPCTYQPTTQRFECRSDD